MKSLSGFLVTVLFGAGAIAQSLSTKIHNPYSSLRALGMGNAFTAVADDYSLIMYNPAGFARKKHNEIQITLAGAGVSDKTLKVADDIKKAADTEGTDSQKAQAVSDELEKYYGESLGGKVQALEMFWVNKGWGVALLPADLTIDMTINRQVGPALDLNVKGDSIFALGFGTDLTKTLDAGITAKYIHRVSVEQIVPAFELATDSNVLSTKRFREGTKADFDLGFMWTPEWFGSGRKTVKVKTVKPVEAVAAPAESAPAPVEPAPAAPPEKPAPAEPAAPASAEPAAAAPAENAAPADAAAPADPAMAAESEAPVADGTAPDAAAPAEAPAASPTDTPAIESSEAPRAPQSETLIAQAETPAEAQSAPADTTATPAEAAAPSEPAAADPSAAPAEGTPAEPATPAESAPAPAEPAPAAPADTKAAPGATPVPVPPMAPPAATAAESEPAPEPAAQPAEPAQAETETVIEEEVQEVPGEVKYPLSFGFAVHNVIGGEFSQSKIVNKDATETPAKLERTFDVGAQYKIVNWEDFTVRYMLDFRNMGYPGANFNKTFHTGIEFDYSPNTWFKTQLRAGMNQMYFTAGASFLFGVLNIDVVTYGEEVGTLTERRESRVTAAKVGFNF